MPAKRDTAASMSAIIFMVVGFDNLGYRKTYVGVQEPVPARLKRRGFLARLERLISGSLRCPQLSE